MEPITIFSLSLAILNIFLNTIASIYDQGDQILTYRKKLMKFRQVLHDCSIAFRLWMNIWERKGLTEAIYRKLFGSDGWKNIKTTKASVMHLLEELHGHLCLKAQPAPERLDHFRAKKPQSKLKWSTWMHAKAKTHEFAEDALAEGAPDAGIVVALEPHQLQTWRQFIDSMEEGEGQGTPDPSIIRRVLGILGPNQRLEKKVADLKEGVNRLHRLSINHFRLMGHGKEEPKQMEDIESTLNKFSFWEFASKFSASVLQHDGPMPNSGWFLQLHFPKEMNDCKTVLTRTVAHCNFRFVTHTASPDGQIFEREVKLLRLRGVLRPEQDIQTELGDEALAALYASGVCNFGLPSSEAYQLKAFQAPTLWTKAWRTLLMVGQEDPSVRKYCELERAKLAFGFTLWMILLWETDWFSHLCTCSFRCVILPEHQP